MLFLWFDELPVEQRALKNMKNCLNTNIYSYLETSGGQISNPYLNVVLFSTPELIRNLWHLRSIQTTQTSPNILKFKFNKPLLLTHFMKCLNFPTKIIHCVNRGLFMAACLVCLKAGNPYWKGKLNTVHLIWLTSFTSAAFDIANSNYFLQNKLP